MKNHYDGLGVPKDASSADIKRAYRDKAKTMHPDKGGDTAEFAEVSRAYDVLKDPDRRLLYDMTGEEQRPPIEIEVQNNLMNGFGRALASAEDIAVIDFVGGEFRARLLTIPDERKIHKARRKVLTAKREKVKSSGTNLVHLLIDKELEQIAAALSVLDHQTEVCKACLAELDKYDEDWEEPVAEASFGEVSVIWSRI